MIGDKVSSTDFAGSYRITRSSREDPPRRTPVTIEQGARAWSIVLGDADGVESRRELTAQLDRDSGTLKGRYSENLLFELSLQPGRTGRRLLCVIDAGIVGSPASSSWEADEGGG